MMNNKMDGKMRKAKLQSAMEYLMTYGWAILVIAVVLGALFGLGIFNGAATLGNGCLAQSGYLCQSAVLSTNGLLSVSIGQVAQQSITVVEVGCSNTASEPNIFTVLSPAVKLQAGQVAQTAFQCDLPTNTLGTSFVGTLWIKYNTSQYPGVTFPAEIGTISERVATLGGSGGAGGGPSHGGGGGSLSCGTPPVTGQSISIFVNSTMSVGILNDVNTSICPSRYRGSPPTFASPITYSWSTTGSCPGWSNPGNVDNYTYTPSASSSTCNIDVSVSDTSGDTGSGSAGPIVITTAPLLLASGQGGVQALTNDRSNVYWGTCCTGFNTANIVQGPIGGGTLTDLDPSAVGNIGGMVSYGGDLYWTDASGGAIDYVPIGGGSVTQLATSSRPGDLVVYNNVVYWTDIVSGDLYSVPITGGAPTVMASGLSGPYTLVTDGVNLYWIDSGDGSIWSIPIGGGTANEIESGANAQGLATDGTNIYWTTPSSVESASVAGGTPTTLATGQDGSGALAIAGSNLYWADETSSGSIETVSTSGGAVTTLAANQDSPQTISTDGVNVYWGDYSSGDIYQTPV